MVFLENALVYPFTIPPLTVTVDLGEVVWQIGKVQQGRKNPRCCYRGMCHAQAVGSVSKFIAGILVAVAMVQCFSWP